MLEFYNFVCVHRKKLFKIVVCMLALAISALLAMRFLPVAFELEGKRYTVLYSSDGLNHSSSLRADDGSTISMEKCPDCFQDIFTVDGKQYIAPGFIGYVHTSANTKEFINTVIDDSCGHNFPPVPFTYEQLALIYDNSEKQAEKSSKFGFGIVLITGYCLFCVKMFHPDLLAWHERWASRDGELSDEFIAVQCVIGAVGSLVFLIGAFWLVFTAV